jgi:nitrate reductase gamma subunit
MYVLLVGAIVLGLWTTLVSVGAGSDAHNYRETVSPWFRSVFLLRPDVEAMAEAPIQFHIHALMGMALFALWPFSRLVHAFTAPVHYLFRPYIVYRSRDQRPVGTRPARTAWSAVGTADRDR